MMNEKRKGKPKKFTDTLRPWIVVRDTDGNLLSDQRVRHVYRVRDGLIERMDVEGPVSEAAAGGA